MRGLYDKYVIQKTDGTPVDPHAVYFVLRLDTDPAARRAVETYAQFCDNQKLADELRETIYLIETWDGLPDNR